MPSRGALERTVASRPCQFPTPTNNDVRNGGLQAPCRPTAQPMAWNESFARRPRRSNQNGRLIALQMSETATPAVRILVADDYEVVRLGITSIFENEPGLHVVAEASDGR